jgi:hypothetical protein
VPRLAASRGEMAFERLKLRVIATRGTSRTRGERDEGGQQYSRLTGAAAACCGIYFSSDRIVTIPPGVALREAP